MTNPFLKALIANFIDRFQLLLLIKQKYLHAVLKCFLDLCVELIVNKWML
jgi:hypothetical protein